MRFRFIFISFLIMTFLLSCHGKNDKKEKSDYKNNILLHTKGFKVKEAYLAFDDSTRLPDNNEAKIGQHVNLLLHIDSGWKAENGRIYPGIGQKVETDDGKHVFNKPDLMETHPEGVPAEDGWQVTIQAVINSADKNYDYFLVSFRVWDKKSDAEITGSYKLHVKL